MHTDHEERGLSTENGERQDRNNGIELSAHLSTLYPDLAFNERISAAAADGFRWVEFWDCEEAPPVGISRRLAEAGLRVALINVSPGWEPDDCGRMADPGAVTWWRREFSETLVAAELLGTRSINLLAGQCPPGGDLDSHGELAWSTLMANLDWAARQVSGSRINLVLEPLNGIDRPGYMLPTCDAAAALISELDAQGTIGLLFDAYHVQMSGADPARLFERHKTLIRHVQLADAPGRHEPGTGSINFRTVFAAIGAGGYQGPVGLEYLPSSGRGANLAWCRQFASYLHDGTTEMSG